MSYGYDNGYTVHDTRLGVMRGTVSPDELPSFKAAKAARDQEYADWKNSGRKEDVMRMCRDGVQRAVPQAILEAEAKDGIERVFTQGKDKDGYPYSIWARPAEPKSDLILAAERFDGIPRVWDATAGVYRKAVKHQMPPVMRRVADSLPENDPRQPRYDWENEKWIFPAILDENLNQVPLPRDDLVSQAGYPLSGPPNILRPGQPLPGYDDLGEGAAAALARATTGPGSLFPPEGGTEEPGGAA